MKLEYFVPVKTISENNVKEHWGKASKRHKLQKKYIWALFHSEDELFKAKWAFPLKITITRMAPRALDAHDNLAGSVKWIVDAISEEILGKEKGAGQKDSDPRLLWEYSQEKSSFQGLRITFQGP